MSETLRDFLAEQRELDPVEITDDNILKLTDEYIGFLITGFMTFDTNHDVEHMETEERLLSKVYDLLNEEHRHLALDTSHLTALQNGLADDLAIIRARIAEFRR